MQNIRIQLEDEKGQSIENSEVNFADVVGYLWESNQINSYPDVRKIEELTNSRTGKTFYWAVIGTMDNEYDVVIDPNFFNRKPVVGNIVHGYYWMSGKIVGDSKV